MLLSAIANKNRPPPSSNGGRTASGSGGKFTASGPLPVVTNSVLLQTSLGPLVVDLYGLDFPATTAHFLSLIRAQLFQGVAVTHLIPDHAVVFSHAFLTPPRTSSSTPQATIHHTTSSCMVASLADADKTQANTGTSTPCPHCAGAQSSTPMNVYTLAAGNSSGSDGAALFYHEREHALQKALREEFQKCKQRRVTLRPTTSASVARTVGGGDPLPEVETRVELVSGAGATGSLRRKGVLFVPAPISVKDGTAHEVLCGQLAVFGLTLADRPNNALDDDHIAIGEIRDEESLHTLDQLRRLAHQRAPQDSSTGSRSSRSPYARWPTPLRMTRVLEVLPLPLCGIPVWRWKASSLCRGSATDLTSSRSERELERESERLYRRLSSGSTPLLQSCCEHLASSEAVRDANRWLCRCGFAAGIAGASRNSASESNTANLNPHEPHHTSEYELLLLRPFEVDAHVLEMKDDEPTDGENSAYLLEKRAREKHWRDLLVEPGIQRLLGNPSASGPLLPAEEREEGSSCTGNRALPSTATHEENEKKVIQSLSLATHLLDGLPVVSGAPVHGSAADASSSSLPFQLLEPCERTLFVCRLNPLTTSEGLAECFASFGQVVSCNVVRDPVTGASLRYGFVEFSNREDCFAATEQMNNTLIDDCRIVTNFSQSVRKAAKNFFQEHPGRRDEPNPITSSNRKRERHT